ncbi:MAG: hypothetical protein Q4C77_18295, partial [Eubacteriales bacterium]|nr:hypothetical protein [Eubacteriales bacterium]
MLVIPLPGISERIKDLSSLMPHYTKDLDVFINMEVYSSVLKKIEEKNKRNVEFTTFLSPFYNAADRNRTGTGITTHGILS